MTNPLHYGDVPPVGDGYLPPPWQGFDGGGGFGGAVHWSVFAGNSGATGLHGEDGDGPGWYGIYYDWISEQYRSTYDNSILEWSYVNDVIHIIQNGSINLPIVHVIWSGRAGSGRLTGGVPDWWGRAQSQGDMNSTNTGSPKWLNTTRRVTAAAGPTNQVKQQLFNYASRTDKTVKNLKYVKGVRNLGTAGTLVGMGVAGYNIATDIQAGNQINSWDVADLGVGTAGLVLSAVLVANPVGLFVVGTVSTIYFTGRLIHDISN